MLLFLSKLGIIASRLEIFFVASNLINVLMLITIQGEYIIEIMKECVEGKHGNMFDEVKVALLSFQNTPPSNLPLFSLSYNP